MKLQSDVRTFPMDNRSPNDPNMQELQAELLKSNLVDLRLSCSSKQGTWVETTTYTGNDRVGLIKAVAPDEDLGYLVSFLALSGYGITPVPASYNGLSVTDYWCERQADASSGIDEPPTQNANQSQLNERGDWFRRGWRNGYVEGHEDGQLGSVARVTLADF